MKERIAVASIVLLCLVGAVDSTAGENEFSWSGPGVVLLKNGNVIAGNQIIPRDKVITIRLDETAKIQVASDQVVHIDTDVRALYNYQVTHTERWETGDHLQLSKWSLRNGLIEEAYAHYVEVKNRSPDHTKFKQLELELRQALMKDPVFQAATRTTFSNSASSASKLGEATQRLDENASEADPNNSKASGAASVISPIQQDYFRRQIQPFMVMRCGQAGCHGTLGKTDFHAAKGGSLKGRSAGEMSLESTIKFLKGNRLEETILWQKATNRHGLQSTAGLDPEDSTERELLQRLRTWHQSLSQPPTTSVSQTNSTPEPFMSARIAKSNQTPPPAVPAQTKTNPSTNQEPSSIQSSPTTSLPDVGVELLALEREIAKLEAVEKSRKPTVDRHDPSEFNRLQTNPLRTTK